MKLRRRKSWRGENWPSVSFHKKLQLLLVIYVDDLKMAGPSKNLKEGW